MSSLDSHVKDAISEHVLSQWAQAMTYIVNHYRVACSPSAIQASAPWFAGKSWATTLSQLACQAGLSFHASDTATQAFGQQYLPVVAELHDGRLMVIEHFNGEDALDVFIIAEGGQRNRLTVAELLSEIVSITALHPSSALKDSRVDRYISCFKPDWMCELVLKDIRPYLPVMIAAFLISVLSLVGIIFSTQVYDRVIPAQFYPTLYVLPTGALVVALFGFLPHEACTHITGLLGKRADMRISDRAFSHALRLCNSAVPRSTGSPISRLRELEQIREMTTSSTMSTIVDLPFFFLSIVVLTFITPPLVWIAPVAALLMILPGLLLQKKLAVLANQATHEPILRNAVLVESVQGLEDTKLMQTENRFPQRWNSYIRITGESGSRTRRLTQGPIGWGTSVQSLVCAVIVIFSAPMIIEGTMTTGVVAAASMFGSRIAAPMANLCGVLARWQQVKAMKMGLDSIMWLPTETQYDEDRVHQEIFHDCYLFKNVHFRYHSDDQRVSPRTSCLEAMPGEWVATLGRNGTGESTLLQAMAGGVEIIRDDIRPDNLSPAQIDMTDLRRNIGFFSRNVRLFFGTLRENLTFDAPYASDAQIFEALEVSGAATFVKQFAKGPAYPVMRGGNGLSGGQRQSVLSARMLLRSFNIVLLGEPSASLDEHTEREFIQRLNQWLGNCTLIATIHRIPVLELIERVVVLKEGQLVMDASKAQALNASRAPVPAYGREWKNENQSA